MTKWTEQIEGFATVTLVGSGAILDTDQNDEKCPPYFEDGVEVFMGDLNITKHLNPQWICSAEEDYILNMRAL